MTDQHFLKIVENHTEGYSDLKYYFANLNTLFSIRGMLAIDMMTTMPQGGLNRRLHDISAITKRIYAETTTSAIARLLDQVENNAIANPGEWSAWDLANLSEMRRIHSHLSALPPELYIASVEIASEGRKRHSEAATQDWSETKPYLTKVIDIYRRMADLKQKKFNSDSPYSALLLGYASDISLPKMDALYGALLEPLAKIRDQAIKKEEGVPPPLPLHGDFTRGDQMWLNRTILEIMGFDFTRGSLQITSLSPMTGGHSDDVRILVRCSDVSHFLDSMEDTLYQGARGLYLQNLPADWAMQPVGQDLGSLMMNTQSHLYETIIGRTPQFFDFIASRAEGLFRQFRNKSFEPENLYRLRKIITPSARRNEADELTKIFHDVMRYRIERDLFDGALSIDDLPERWNEESTKYLGTIPQTANEGPLQNPDWFTGRFGYIPTNTLSHIMAGALHEKIYNETGNLSDMIQFGNLKPVNQWMKTHIHAKGRSIPAIELVEQVTGQALSVEPLLQHFERRYLSDKR